MNRFLLEWVPWIFNKTSIALDIAVRALTAAYTEVSVEKEWLLLHSIQIPLSSMTFPTEFSSLKAGIITSIFSLLIRSNLHCIILLLFYQNK